MATVDTELEASVSGLVQVFERLHNAVASITQPFEAMAKVQARQISQTVNLAKNNDTLERTIKAVQSNTVDYTDAVTGLTAKITRQNQVNTARIEKEKRVQAAQRASLSSTEKQTSALKRLAQQSEKNAKRLDSIGKAMDAIRLPGAGLFRSVKDINESMKDMAEQGDTTHLRLLKLGIGVGALVAAALAATASVVAVTAAIVKAAFSAAQLNKELEPFRKRGFFRISDSDTRQIETVRASFDALKATMKALIRDIGAKLAPQIQYMTTLFVALGLAAIDAWNGVGTGNDVMQKLAEYSARVLTEALFLPVTAVAKLGEAFAELGDVTVKLGPTAKNAIGALIPGAQAAMSAIEGMGAGAKEFSRIVEGWKADQADAVTAALKMMARDGMEPLKAVTRDYMGEAQRLVKVQGAITRATDKGKEKVKQATDTLKRYGDAVTSIISRGYTPLEAAQKRYAKDLATLDKAYDAGAITALEYTRGLNQIESELGSVEIAGYKTATALERVISGDLGKTVNKIDFAGLAGKVAGIAGEVIGVVVKAIKSAVSFVKNLGTMLVEVFSTPGTGKALVENLVNALSNATCLVDVITESLVEGFEALASKSPVIVKMAITFVNAIVEAMPKVFNAIVDALPAVIASVTNALPVLLDGIVNAINQALLCI